MIRRLFKIIKYVSAYVFGVIVIIPIGIYWVITGDQRPLEWLEKFGNKLINQ